MESWCFGSHVGWWHCEHTILIANFVSMVSRSRSRSPVRTASSLDGELWRRLETFSHKWIDGDGHSILRVEPLMESVRQCVPEIQDSVRDVPLVFVSPEGSVREDPSVPAVPGEVAGVPSLSLHQLVHSVLREELSSNGRFQRGRVKLEMWSSLGRGFCAREIQRLLSGCFESLRRLDSELAGAATALH